MKAKKKTRQKPETPEALKKKPEALFGGDEIYKVLFELSPSGILLEDDKGTVIDANTVYCESLGYERDEIIGKSVRIFTHPGTAVEVEKNIRMMLTGETLVHVEESVKKDGSRCFLRLHEKKITLPDGRDGILCLTEDITEHMKLEAQLAHAQKMESIGTLAGGIAHDFNNLLMGIHGNISLMLAGTTGNKKPDSKLKIIEDYVRRGEDLTRQLLGFAMKGKYVVKALDMNALIRQSAKMFGRTRKEIRIHLKLAKGLRLVEADRGQMEQVLMNLFINAWQAMPSGGDLFIQTGNEDLDQKFASAHNAKSGKFVRISVTDTGTGMNSDTLKKIFDPFFTTRKNGKGTGLGLASVYGIIRNHSGFLTVYSEPGEGATFNVFLPSTTKQLEKVVEPDLKISMGNETLLLVDDEDVALTVISEMLEYLGYRVHSARTGEDALKIFREHRETIDLVILDMVMPGLGGEKTFDQLREMDPNVRVLLSSGFSMNGQASLILGKGCSGFIQKPFGIEQLSTKLREILDKSSK